MRNLAATVISIFVFSSGSLWRRVALISGRLSMR